MVVSITAFRDVASGETLLDSVSSIDATADSTTNLYTVPAGQTVVITKVVLRVTAIDTLSVNPIGGVGIAAGEDDIFSPLEITGLTAVGDCWVFDAQAKAVDASASEIIKLGLDTLATATTLTLACDIFGYFVGGTAAQPASPAAGSVVSIATPGSINIPNTAWTELSWDTEEFDDAAFHDLVTNPQRFTAPSDGLYRVELQIGFSANASGSRAVRVLLNGAGDGVAYDQRPALSGAPSVVDCSRLLRLTAGDYLSGWAFQSAGGPLGLEPTVSLTWFSIVRLGD